MNTRINVKMQVDEPEQKVEPDKLKADILELIKAYNNGISEEELSNTMVGIDPKLRMDAINVLTSEGKVELFKKGSGLIYRAATRSTANHSAVFESDHTTAEEKAIYRVVENAGSKGIWNREIRNLTKIPLNNLSKALKQLETKKLIKAVKSVTASKRKLYMLYGLEPDKSVTGGAWYSGTEFESEYVQILYEQCHQFVKRRLNVTPSDNQDLIDARDAALVSSAEVKEYIDDLKISTVKLSLEDIEMVLETIVFDGLIEKITVPKTKENLITPIAGATEVKIEKLPTLTQTTSVSMSDEEEGETSNESHFYRALNKLVSSTGIMRSPCGQCPYVHECRPGAFISPDKCVYFERWFAT